MAGVVPTPARPTTATPTGSSRPTPLKVAARRRKSARSRGVCRVLEDAPYDSRNPRSRRTSTTFKGLGRDDPSHPAPTRPRNGFHPPQSVEAASGRRIEAQRRFAGTKPRTSPLWNDRTSGRDGVTSRPPRVMGSRIGRVAMKGRLARRNIRPRDRCGRGRFRHPSFPSVGPLTSPLDDLGSDR